MPETPSLGPRHTGDLDSTADGPLGVANRAREARIFTGVVNAGRYLLGEEIARGGMGVVYCATDTILGREVAVKVLQEKYAPDSATARRFADEARITGQLQHPNIPAVHDLGVFSDGRPFLAMKLIKGETLEMQLRRRGEPFENRGQFLAAFEQVCQAVAYAHAHGVIHRDLKPANVMVGAFGEVQVMDWGLAKVLGSRPVEQTDPEETTAPTAVHCPRESDDPFTHEGSVLGTPAYMPPEQAAGAVGLIDRRSDVFGLGAVLAVVLTGRPPFVADTSESTRVKAAQGDVAECFARLEECGADPDLVALCKRCLAPRPADRPSDADEVAKAVAALRAAADERARRAELERVQAEGEARAAEARAVEQGKRRRMQLVLSGVIALVLLAGLGVSLWQMRRALLAEVLANTNAQDAREERDAKARALAAEQQARQQAFAALRSMTTDVVENKFTQGKVLTDDDRAFLRGIIVQLDAFAAIKSENPESQALRAEGRERVGIMRWRLGELKEAEQDYDQALAIQEQLVADIPDSAPFRNELANIHTNRGHLLSDTGRLKEAEQDYDQALRIYQQLAADFPSQPGARQRLALCHNHRGNLLANTGRLKEAEQEYDKALEIYQQLTADFPSRSDFRHTLAMSHGNRGVLLHSTRRLTEAEKDYAQAVAIFKQLVSDLPSPRYREDLARGYNSRGVLLRQTGRLKEAEEDCDQAINIQKQLAAEFPSRPEFRQNLARSHGNRGLLLGQTNRPKEAENDYDQAFNIQKQLAAEFPDQPDVRNELAATCVNLALLHQKQGNLTAAKRLLLEGRPHHLAALKANARHPTYRQFYINHLAVLTAVHAGLLEQEDAVRTAQISQNLGWDPPVDAYSTVCFLSRCVPLVAKHDKLNEPQRKQAAQIYADAAMKVLHAAVSKGYKAVAHMKRDTDLDPLRQREDFQKLTAELEQKGR
jgi:tetratricopeptide (TPR) repeat protein